MKSGPRVVIRYSSTHVKVIPDRSFLRRMVLHRTPHARSLRARTPKDPPSSRDPKRRLLPPKKRLPIVAPSAPRLPQVANRLPLLQEMALREGTWERMNRSLLERSRVRLGRDPQPSAAVVDSHSVKSTAVGSEQRGYEGGKRR
jgi:hypothetical protein